MLIKCGSDIMHNDLILKINNTLLQLWVIYLQMLVCKCEPRLLTEPFQVSKVGLVPSRVLSAAKEQTKCAFIFVKLFFILTPVCAS